MHLHWYADSFVSIAKPQHLTKQCKYFKSVQTPPADGASSLFTWRPGGSPWRLPRRQCLLCGLGSRGEGLKLQWSSPWSFQRVLLHIMLILVFFVDNDNMVPLAKIPQFFELDILRCEITHWTNYWIFPLYKNSPQYVKKGKMFSSIDMSLFRILWVIDMFRNSDSCNTTRINSPLQRLHGNP